jgi:hypothetical protein
MNSPKTFAERLVETVDKTELDCDFPFYTGENGERNEVLSPSLPFVEVPSLPIDEVIAVLQQLKDKGANRVYIADHVDHHGYYFYGTKLQQLD